MVHRHVTRSIDLSGHKDCIIAAISDSHGKPHRNLFPAMEQYRPSLILHAGDVGNLDLIMELEGVGQTVYVRGNVDPTGPMWPDSVSLRIKLDSSRQIDLLLLHSAIARFKLNREALNLLRQNPAQIVVFGHSHVPFLGLDGERCLFNPGSSGPSRMRLPITMGFIEVSHDHLNFRHLDLCTGERWKPVSE
jgi:uncharacterized protein